MCLLGVMTFDLIFKSPPTLWWWRLIVFAESARRRLFLLSLENPYSDYFQIFAVCILALGICLVNFFFAFFSFFNKIQGRQNPIAHAKVEALHRFVSCLV